MRRIRSFRPWLASGLLPLLAALAMPLQAADKGAAEAAFARADTNQDGKLSRAEAARLPEIAARFDELDRDKDGFLSLEEFLVGTATPR